MGRDFVIILSRHFATNALGHGIIEEVTNIIRLQASRLVNQNLLF
jgi:hypothetical protein